MLPLHKSLGMETRGNGMKLAKKGCNGLIRQNFFGMRMVNEWNELAEEVVQASSVNCFKGRFDRQCVRNRFSMEWRPVAVRTGAKGEWSQEKIGLQA